MERWAEREWLDPDLARLTVRKCDQQRAGFIKYYFDRDWDDPLHYDLVLNTSRFSEDMAIKLIGDAIKDQNLQEAKEVSKKKLQDLIIKKKTEIKLLSCPSCGGLHLGHFKLQVHGRVLTLDGHVHSQEEFDAVEKMLATIEGIEQLENNLKVRQYRTDPRDH